MYRSSFFYGRKNCKLYFQFKIGAEAVPASFARSGRKFLASERLHHPKIMEENTTAFHSTQLPTASAQLPFTTCNSANHERHFHNNGQVHTLILTYHLQVSANVASTHPTGQRTFSQCNAAGTSKLFQRSINQIHVVYFVMRKSARKTVEK